MKHSLPGGSFEDLVADRLPTLDAETRHRLVVHWDLVCRWNQTHNLTAITDSRQAVDRHYYDALVALPWLEGHVVDLGSGAGFPGLVLAATDASRSVTLVEPRRKRASFLRLAAGAMKLPHVQVLEQRAEQPPARRYATVTLRALRLAPAVLDQWALPGGLVLRWTTEPQSEDLQPHDSKLTTYHADGRHRVLYGRRLSDHIAKDALLEER